MAENSVYIFFFTICHQILPDSFLKIQQYTNGSRNHEEMYRIIFRQLEKKMRAAEEEF